MSSIATGSSRLSCKAGRKCRCSQLGGLNKYSLRFAFKSFCTAASMISTTELHFTWLTPFSLFDPVGGYGRVMVDAMGPLVGAHICHCLQMSNRLASDAFRLTLVVAFSPRDAYSRANPTNIEGLDWIVT